MAYWQFWWHVEKALIQHIFILKRILLQPIFVLVLRAANKHFSMLQLCKKAFVINDFCSYITIKNIFLWLLRFWKTLKHTEGSKYNNLLKNSKLRILFSTTACHTKARTLESVTQLDSQNKQKTEERVLALNSISTFILIPIFT